MSKSMTSGPRLVKDAKAAHAARQTGGASRNGAGAIPEATRPAVDLSDPGLYLNRELSLLAFQRRVLEEALDPANPLLERVKFLAILGSNLDEFFMVRVAGLVAQADAGAVDATPDGATPRAQLIAIRREVKRLFKEAHKCLEELMPALEEHGIFIRDYADLKEAQLRAARKYFEETVFPGADAAGLRPRPPVSPHLQSQPEPGGAHQGPQRLPALRARQSARLAAATGLR